MNLSVQQTQKIVSPLGILYYLDVLFQDLEQISLHILADHLINTIERVNTERVNNRVNTCAYSGVSMR